MGRKRKTKEEKIRAKIRKLQKQLAEKPTHEEIKTKAKSQREETSPLKPGPPIQETTESYNQNYLFSDLRKTSVLTSLAIGLELMVYWWLRNK